MQDFPEDGGKGMSQVFHGEKALNDLPSPPAVCVNGSIYFVDELLRESMGGYFIPERFFLATPSVAAGKPGNTPTDNNTSDPLMPMNMEAKELYALGHAIERTEVGCGTVTAPCVETNTLFA